MKKSGYYTDAQKAAYWKAKASKSKPRKVNYKKKAMYVTAKSDARLKEAEARRNATKEAGVISAIGGAAGGYIGTALGGPIGTAAGSFLGGKIGHLVEKITGFGDYKIANNSIMKGGMSPPYVVNSMNKGSVIVRHREYICDIAATTAFTVRSFPINPGLPQTFPWLSQIAASFEQFRMRGCLFEFLSTSSDALLSTSTSTALGTVNMATQYDVAHPDFPDKRSMLNHEFANSSKPSCTFIHPIECKKSRTTISELYTRDGEVPDGSDPHLYDLGNFQIATEGMQASGGVLGELWVTYEVELFKQQFNILSYCDHFSFTDVSSNTWTKLPVTSQSGNLGGYIPNSHQYSFPGDISSGQFMITYICVGGSASLGSVDSNLTLTNCAIRKAFHNGTEDVVQNGGTSTVLMTQFAVQITAPGASITFGTIAIPALNNYADLWVMRLADNTLSA